MGVGDVSEELNSVETGLSLMTMIAKNEFQKNLIVWKPGQW